MDEANLTRGLFCVLGINFVLEPHLHEKESVHSLNHSQTGATLLSCSSMRTSMSLPAPPRACQPILLRETLGRLLCRVFGELTLNLAGQKKFHHTEEWSITKQFKLSLGGEDAKSRPPYMYHTMDISFNVYRTMGLGKWSGAFKRSVLPSGREK
jgi:hypothetical protein